MEQKTAIKSLQKASSQVSPAPLDWDQVRWYVLTLPPQHRGAVKGLQAEQQRRLQRGERALEIFAPTYEEVVRRGSKYVKTRRPLLFNYVFVRASVRELYALKNENLSLFSFLRCVKGAEESYYPYLSEEAMRNLQWLAASYENCLPICAPQSVSLAKGDRVRIVAGQFKGVEATVEFQTGAGSKHVVVRVEDWLSVPLIQVQEHQYEVLELGGDNKRISAKLDNPRLTAKLHEALLRHHQGVLSEEDRQVAERALREYGQLHCSGEQAAKVQGHLLVAYRVLGREEEFLTTLALLRGRLEEEGLRQQLRVQLLVTLYGCTNDYRLYEEAHSAAAWHNPTTLKRGYREVYQRLCDFDRLFGHA